MHIALGGWFWDRPETGSGQYLRRLLAALGAAHPEATFSLFLPRPTDEAFSANVAPRALSAPRGALGKVWWEQVQLPRAAARLGADLLHVPYWAGPVASALPTVVTIHDLIPLLLPVYRGGPGVRLYTALVSASAGRATRILTDSEASRADIVRELAVPAARVRAVWLAADPAYCPEPQPDDHVILGRLGLQPGYLLYLGGFDVRKNLSAVMAAFAWVYRQFPDSRLVVAGRLPETDTPFAPDPRRLAREAGLPEAAVCFTGFVAEADKPALYRGTRAFLFPSRYEGFGLPALEALACGAPVVGSDAASLPEVVGNAGVLTDPDDVAGMAGALLQLCSDDAFHAELARRALRQAARFSWAATAAATFEVYQESLSAGPVRA